MQQVFTAKIVLIECIDSMSILINWCQLFCRLGRVVTASGVWCDTFGFQSNELIGSDLSYVARQLSSNVDCQSKFDSALSSMCSPNDNSVPVKDGDIKLVKFTEALKVSGVSRLVNCTVSFCLIYCSNNSSTDLDKLLTCVLFS
jgi:hypothetical protein